MWKLKLKALRKKHKKFSSIVVIDLYVTWKDVHDI